jgi:hypothetical protein
VRRLVALLVIALVGAVLYGLSNHSSGITVNGSTVSSSTFRAELTAISTNANLECYVEKIDPASFAPGAGGASMGVTGAAAWANLRVEGLAIDDFATTHLKFHPDAEVLANARTSLEGELSAASADSSSPCPGTSADALAEMPTEMRNFEITSQAASLDLVAKLNTTVPLTVASMKQYYSTHAADYDTICVSVAVVDPTQVTAFNAAQQAGMSVAALAKKFSADPSGKKGGTYGCYGPSNSDFAGVRTATASTPLNTFPTMPEQITYDNETAALFVAPTSRKPTPFAQAESAVLSDLETANATAANTEKERILYYYSSVAIDPSFGRWGLGSNGPNVFAPALPSKGYVGTETIAALAVGASTYK